LFWTLKIDHTIYLSPNSSFINIYISVKDTDTPLSSLENIFTIKEYLATFKQTIAAIIRIATTKLMRIAVTMNMERRYPERKMIANPAGIEHKEATACEHNHTPRRIRIASISKRSFEGA